MTGLLRRLLATKAPEPKIIYVKEPLIWHEVAKYPPPDKVVLAACDTYDCGWVIDTAWWSEGKQQWYATGPVYIAHAHLPYTHWAELPEPPDNSDINP
jgi:hypothetical protein